MKEQLLTHWPTSLIVGACTLTALWLIGELFVLPVTPEPTQPPPPAHGPTKSQELKNFSLPPLEQYQAFVSKPLFIKGRIPVAPEDSGTTTSATQTVSSKPPKVQLTGILETPAVGKLVLLRSIDGKNHYRLKPGEDIEGWRLNEVASDHVVLEQGSKTHTLKLIKPRPKTSIRHPTRRPRRSRPPHRPRTASKTGKKP